MKTSAVLVSLLLLAGCAGEGPARPAPSTKAAAKCMDCGTVRWVQESFGGPPMTYEVRVDMDFGDVRTMTVHDMAGLKPGDRVRIGPFGIDVIN